MPDTTPRINDTDNTLLKKICLLLDGAIASGVISFNARTGAITLTQADVSAVADARYVLKSGDTMTGALVVGGMVTANTGGILLNTIDSATNFAYTSFFRKRGATGDVNAAVASGAEVGNLAWQSWNGSAYVSNVTMIVKTDQAQSGGNAGGHLEFRVTPIGSALGAEVLRLQNKAATGSFLSFGDALVTVPALKRALTDVQVRLGDDSAYASLDVLTVKSSGTQVVSSRKTGWTAATGTATRTSFDTATVTTELLAQRLKALLDDLISHGLIGA